MTINETANSIVHQSDHCEVSAYYRHTAIETASDKLNRDVIKNAAKATRPDGNVFWALSWLRPAAIAATIVLSIALVVQIGDLPLSGISGNGIEPSPAVPLESVIDAAAEVTMEQIRAAEATAQQSLGKSDVVEQQGESVTPGNATNFSPPTSKNCAAEQKATTASWWQCIQSLQRRGLTTAAKMELEALFDADPAFLVPD